MSAGQVVSAQISYVPGWRATVNGAAKPVASDSLGLIVIDAGCQGPCSIELDYTGGVELLITRMLSASAAIIALALWWRSRVLARPLRVEELVL
jgi:hypothetical protein